MPTWSDTPAPAGDRPSFRLVRTPASGILRAIITCSHLHGCATHYVSNRTIPCEGAAQCEACQNGHSWRWHAYVSAVLTQGMEHILIEFTAAAAETLTNYDRQFSTIRGALIESTRPTNRLNGRVIVRAKPVDLTVTRIPDEPPVRKLLCQIWGIQYVDAEPTTSARPPQRQILVPAAGHDARYNADGNHHR